MLFQLHTINYLCAKFYVDPLNYSFVIDQQTSFLTFIAPIIKFIFEYPHELYQSALYNFSYSELLEIRPLALHNF